MPKHEVHEHFYIARADGTDKHGAPVKLRLGFERGMTDNGQPCWSRYSATEFKELAEAQELMPYVGATDSIHVDRESIRFFEVTRVTVVTTDEREIK